MPTESAKSHLEDAFSRTRDDDRWLAEIAERQHGVVSRRQLLEAGFGRGAIAARCKAGRLHRLQPGVYLVGHRLIQREGRWMAAVLSSGPDAVLSHWSAAALLGIRSNSRSTIDVTVPHRSRSWHHIRRHLSRLPLDERTMRIGIPVTTAPRTVLDLAATAPLDVVKALLREMEFRELWDSLSLGDLVERYPRRRGIRTLRLALEGLGDEPPGELKSPLEERFHLFLLAHRLPLPRFNDWIDAGGRNFQVDCHWPELRQIVELDGWQGHKSRSAFRADRARDRILNACGYTVTRLTWNQLEDEPEAIASDLRVLLLPAGFRGRRFRAP